MGLFNQHFDRPGPGVAKDAPRKKGPARYFEVLFRDFGSFFSANLLCAAGFAPFLLLAGAGLLTVSLPLTILGGVLGVLLMLKHLFAVVIDLVLDGPDQFFLGGGVAGPPPLDEIQQPFLLYCVQTVSLP